MGDVFIVDLFVIIDVIMAYRILFVSCYSGPAMTGIGISGYQMYGKISQDIAAVWNVTRIVPVGMGRVF